MNCCGILKKDSNSSAMRRHLLLISKKTSSLFGMMSKYPRVQRRVGTQRGVGVQEGIMKGMGFELSL